MSKKNKDVFAGLYVVLRINGELFVRSTNIMMEETWRDFWNAVSEWTWVELKWWCEDKKMNKEGFGELVKSMSPDVYHVNFGKNSLEALDEKNYTEALKSKDKKDRQFAFLSKEKDKKEVEEALQQEITDVVGWKGSRKFTRIERPEEK